MSTSQISGLGSIPPGQTAEFVAEMLGELAELSERAGLEHSSRLIAAVIPVLRIEAPNDQSDPSG